MTDEIKPPPYLLTVEATSKEMRTLCNWLEETDGWVPSLARRIHQKALEILRMEQEA